MKTLYSICRKATKKNNLSKLLALSKLHSIADIKMIIQDEVISSTEFHRVLKEGDK